MGLVDSVYCWVGVYHKLSELSLLLQGFSENIFEVHDKIKTFYEVNIVSAEEYCNEQYLNCLPFVSIPN